MRLNTFASVEQNDISDMVFAYFLLSNSSIISCVFNVQNFIHTFRPCFSKFIHFVVCLYITIFMTCSYHTERT